MADELKAAIDSKALSDSQYVCAKKTQSVLDWNSPVKLLSPRGVMATSSRSQVGSGLGRIGVAVVANGSSWPVLMDAVTVQTTTTEQPVARPGEAIPVRATLLTPASSFPGLS